MTDQSPTPTPSVEPKSGWHTLSQNSKIARIIGAVFALFIVISLAGGGSGQTTTTTTEATPTTISTSQQWSDWKSSFLSVVSQTQSDYTQTQADLTNGDYSASTQDFATLSQDATNIGAMNDSIDPSINADVTQLSIAIQNVATTGISALNSSDTTAFENAINAYGVAVDTLTTDLATANSTY